MSVLKNTVQLGVYFMLLFTSDSSYYTIISQLYQKKGYYNLGKYSLFTSYGIFMISNMFTPYFGNKFNAKLLMAITGFCYSLNYFTGFIVQYLVQYQWMVYSLVIFGAVLSGLSSSPLWVAQADYLHTLCQVGKKHDQKGYYFGLFYQLYAASNILAGIVTTFLLGFFSNKIYFLITAGISIFSVLYLIFFVENIETKQQLKSLKYNEIKFNQQQNDNQIKIKQEFDILSVFKYYTKMYLLLPFIGLIGILIGFYSSSLFKLIQQTLPEHSSHQYIMLMSGIGMIFLGFGQVFGGYVSRKNSDNLNIKTIGGISISFFLVTCQLCQIVDSTRNKVLVFFVAFLLGLCNSYIQNWILVVCSRNHRGKLQSFSINKQFHSFALCIYEIILIFINPSINIILTALTLLTVLCILSVSQLVDVDEQKNFQIQQIQ